MNQTLTEYIATINTHQCLICGRHYNSNFAPQCPSCGSSHKRHLKHWEH